MLSERMESLLGQALALIEPLGDFSDYMWVSDVAHELSDLASRADRGAHTSEDHALGNLLRELSTAMLEADCDDEGLVTTADSCVDLKDIAERLYALAL